MHSAVAHPPDWREGCNSPASPLSHRPWPCPLADGCCHVSPCAAQCGAYLPQRQRHHLPLGAVGGGSAALRRPSHQRLSCFVRRYTRRQIHVCRSPSEPSRNLARFARLTPKLKPSLSHQAPAKPWRCVGDLQGHHQNEAEVALAVPQPCTPAAPAHHPPCLPAYFCPSYFCPSHPAWRVASGHDMDGSRIPSGAVLHSLTRPTHTAISNPQPSAALHSPTRCATNSPSFRGPKLRLALLPPIPIYMHKYGPSVSG
jgi:hypothetical protein